MSVPTGDEKAGAASQRTFARRVAQGARWSTLGVILVTLVQVVRVIVLGSLLGPEPFGLLAMMMVFVQLAELSVQFGLGEAIIQHRDPSLEQRSTLFWMNAALGIGAFGLLVLLSPAVSALYSTPALADYLPWLASVLIVTAWASQIRAQLQKKLEFAGQSMVEALAVAVGLVVSISMAVIGHDGIWVLVVGQMVQSFSLGLAYILLGARHRILPGLVFDIGATRPLLRFGMKVMLSNLTSFANARVDQLLVGSLLGAQSLGYYVMAFNLVVQPFMKIGSVVSQLAFPALSTIRDDATRVREAYFRMLDLIASFNAPLLLGAVVVAPSAISLLLGESWIPATTLVQTMAVFSLVRSINSSGGSLVLSFGGAGRVLVWNIGLLLVVPASLLIGIRLGDLEGAAIALLGVQSVAVFAWYGACVRPFVGHVLRDYLGSFLPGISLSIAMAIVVFLVGQTLPETPAFSGLLVQIAAGAICYLLLTWVFRRRFLHHALDLARLSA